MHIRSFASGDAEPLIALTIEVFEPFFEQSLPEQIGAAVAASQESGWRDNYRTKVPRLHAPQDNKFVAVACEDDQPLGYVAWAVNPAERLGTIELLAVRAAGRGRGLGRELCEHALADLRQRKAEVLEIGTGGDRFHAPARALYESLGCRPLPLVRYYRQL